MATVGNVTHIPSAANNSGSVTFNHTSNSDTLEVSVLTADGAGGVVPSGVTVDGAAMSLIGSITDGGGGHFAASQWGKAGVTTSGSRTIVVTWPGSAAQAAGCDMVARSIIGADQTTPFNTGGTGANAANSTPSVTCNSTSGQLVVGGVITFSTSITSGGNDFVDNNLGALGFTSAAGDHSTASGSTTSFTWTETGVQGNGWAAVAVSVNDAAAGTPPPGQPWQQKAQQGVFVCT